MNKLSTARSKKFGHLNNENNENFVVSDYFKKLSDGTIFYQGEDSLGNHFFATKQDLMKIVENREFFFDSTFLPVSKISFFYQLSILSIRETFENDAILSNPLIFILKRNKKTENYESIFNYIKELTSQTNTINQVFSPAVFHVDFELGQKKAIKFFQTVKSTIVFSIFYKVCVEIYVKKVFKQNWTLKIILFVLVFFNFGIFYPEFRRQIFRIPKFEIKFSWS